jgi:hypothetical protein
MSPLEEANAKSLTRLALTNMAVVVTAQTQRIASKKKANDGDDDGEKPKVQKTRADFSVHRTFPVLRLL